MTDTVDLLAGLRTGDWLDIQHFPPLAYAVPGIVPEGFSLLVSPPKAGKSWLALGVALGVAAGGHVLGRLPVDPRPVLYLALEDGDRRLQDRCRVLLGDEPIPAGFEYLTEIVPDRLVPTLEAWLSRYPNDAPLVIVDTLGKVMPQVNIGESAYARDYRVGGTIKRIIDDRPGGSLMVVHHTRKAVSEDFVDNVSGTHGLAGAADTIIVLGRARHETEATLKVTGRDVAEGEYALSFTQGGVWKLSGSSLAAAAAEASRRRVTEDLGDLSIEIVNYVHAHPDGVRAKDVEDKFGLNTRRYLRRLLDTGRIANPSRGVYTPPVTSVSVSQTTGTPPSGWDNGTHETPPLERCDQCGGDTPRTVIHHATGEHWCPPCCHEAPAKEA